MNEKIFSNNSIECKSFWAIEESARLHKLASQFGFSPRKTQYNLDPPLGSIESRLKYLNQGYKLNKII